MAGVFVAHPAAWTDPSPHEVKTLAGQQRFATSSLRVNSGEAQGAGSIRLIPNGRFQASGATLRALVAFAWQRHVFDQREVEGGPAWIDSVRFDIDAAAAAEHEVDADGMARETLLMLRALLATEVGLRVHEEPRERPVYRLTHDASASGPRLRVSPLDCRWMLTGKRPDVPPGQGPPCGTKTPPGRLFANTVTMAAFASLLSPHADRPVIDATGLAGRFDVELESDDIKARPGYTPGPSDLALPPAKGPALAVAVREQLGLRLEPARAAIDVIVIDAARRPEGTTR
jgi:uncharacterized protein (TIGR03435 family)